MATPDDQADVQPVVPGTHVGESGDAISVANDSEKTSRHPRHLELLERGKKSKPGKQTASDVASRMLLQENVTEKGTNTNLDKSQSPNTQAGSSEDKRSATSSIERKDVDTFAIDRSRIARSAQARNLQSRAPLDKEIEREVPVSRPSARVRLRGDALSPAAPLPLPQRIKKRSRGTLISFLLFVGLPTLLAVVYYCFIASNQYVSEFKFAVRDSQTAVTGTDGSVSGGLGGISISSSPSSTASYIVADYLTSEQAIYDIRRTVDVQKLYSRPAADWLARFNDRLPIEQFVRYWQRMVTSTFDAVTGLGVLEVHAFTPQDAYIIASTLADLAENLVNDITQRPQRDAVRFAEDALQNAQDRLKSQTENLRRFRDTEQVINPNDNIVASNVLLAQTLRSGLAQLRTELSSLTKQNLGANAPITQQLQSRIKATREQLAAVDAQIANSRDGASPIAKVVGEYESLELQLQFAQNQVQATMQNLELARKAAREQHMYVVRYVTPKVPESALYPKRLLSIGIVALFSLLFWTVGLLLVRSIREQVA